MAQDQVIGIVSPVKVKSGRENEYYDLLLTLIADHSTREPDCIDIVVHRGADDPGKIMLYERWRIPSQRFVPEQMSKPFIEKFTERTRDMVLADEDVTYWNAIERVAGGERTELAGALLVNM